MKKASEHRRETAYTLETGPEHRRYYDGWAPSYDTKFADAEGYVYPAAVASRFLEIADAGDSPVADIGCGTGLVGTKFKGAAFEIDGFDISPGMIREAEKKGVYGKLVELDLLDRKDLPVDKYGGLVSCGTFTLGHLGPDGLMNSLVLAKRGALCVFGINARHFEQAGFEEFLRRLCREGRTTAPQIETVRIYDSTTDDADLVNLAKLAIFRTLE
ncbi:MAG: methyltransferase domain-containing protein [Albidovulum sp.]|nr:methyltransferase domain-containing protein [Albidovulum sp.]MDE0530575.1 methyltransferase domain-containing protein [Albidovulum sp.]